MRVKITYTVELEKVEQEVSEIMSRAVDSIDFAYQETVNTQNQLDTSTGVIEEQLETIDKIRIKLANADQTLEDCYLILKGLEAARKQLEEKENEIQNG